MYEAYWQLDAKPFEWTPSARFYYPGEAHQGALLKLRYAIENHRGAALLAGAPGLGKTLILQRLRQQLDERYLPLAQLVFPQMSPAELLAWVADALDPPATTARGPLPPVNQSVDRIQAALEANSQRGRQAVVVLDEAHLIEEHETLEALRLLLNFETSTGPGLALVLAGQPALLSTFQRMPHWEERLGIKCLLRPLNVAETMAYVTHRLTAAGATRPIFTADSLEAIYYLTQGNPRRINRLCDLALLVGYAEQAHEITVEALEAVAGELVTVQPE
ncbi:MAG: AAA family ATPase [Pirellulales bacterium]|nr:AAA family ATPase [Pirellulales bacterium]